MAQKPNNSTRPAKVRVIGKIYAVEWCDLINHDGSDVNGLFDPDKQHIQVLATLPLESEQDALLHEVMHAVEYSMGLDIDDDIINRLATGLLGVLKDNPRFVSYLRRRK